MHGFCETGNFTAIIQTFLLMNIPTIHLWSQQGCNANMGKVNKQKAFCAKGTP